MNRATLLCGFLLVSLTAVSCSSRSTGSGDDNIGLDAGADLVSRDVGTTPRDTNPGLDLDTSSADVAVPQDTDGSGPDGECQEDKDCQQSYSPQEGSADGPYDADNLMCVAGPQPGEKICRECLGDGDCPPGRRCLNELCGLDPNADLGGEPGPDAGD